MTTWECRIAMRDGHNRGLQLPESVVMTFALERATAPAGTRPLSKLGPSCSPPRMVDVGGIRTREMACCSSSVYVHGMSEIFKFRETLATDNSAFVHHETTTSTHPVSMNYSLQAIIAP